MDPVAGPVVDPAEVVTRLAAEVDRVANRLRGLGAARLARPLPPYDSVADAGRALAAELAAAAHGVEARGDSSAPSPRVLPALPDAAVGDQVAVTGHDLVMAVEVALASYGPDAPAWAADGTRTTAVAQAEALAARTREVKLAVD